MFNIERRKCYEVERKQGSRIGPSGAEGVSGPIEKISQLGTKLRARRK
jgi:hypothetical protein